MLKSCLVAAERGFRQKRGNHRGSSKATVLGRLEGEPSKEMLAQPCLGTSQSAEVGQVVVHLPDKFHLLT